jgi:hypothetical protein
MRGDGDASAVNLGRGAPVPLVFPVVLRLDPAASAEDVSHVRVLLLEYAESLGVDLRFHRFNPVPGAMFMELDLSGSAGG